MSKIPTVNEQEYQELMNSHEFKLLYNHVSDSNMRFNELPEKERRLALAITMRGDESLVRGLEDLMYIRPVPKIEEILSDRKYLGTFGQTLFSYWRNELTELFSDNNSYHEGVYGGAIGIGKSSVARAASFINLIRVSCLRYPQLTLGQQEETLLATQMMSVNLDKAWLTLMAPMFALFRASEFFMEVEKVRELEIYKDAPRVPFCRDGGYIRLPRGVLVTSGSTESHALGMTLIGAILDEAEFRGGDIFATFDLYTQLKERVNSRMLDQNTGMIPKYIMLSLVSSAKTQNGVIYNYTKAIPEDDPHTRIMGRPIWDVKDTSPYDRGYFYVLRGTKSHPSQILDGEHMAIENGTYEPPTNCKVIKVPIYYERQFKTRIEQALQNLAGEETISDDMPFDNLADMEFDELLPEMNLVARLGSKTPLITQLPKELFMNTTDGRVFSRYPSAPRYLHADLALSSSSNAGLSIVHKELNDTGEPIIVVDLAMWITSPTRIDLRAVEQFIVDLVKIFKLNIHTVSADQFQSASMRQFLEMNKVARNVAYLSVDRTSNAYDSLASIIAAGLFRIGRCPKLKEQLEAISIVNNKPMTRGKKDLADSIAGATYNALMNPKDVPVYSYSQYSKLKENNEVMYIDNFEELSL